MTAEGLERPTTSEAKGFRVLRMHHPTHRSDDLPAAEAWFQEVFGCPSTSIGEVLAHLTVRDDWPRDYSIYTPIRDVFFDTVDPNRFVVGGVRKYPPIDRPHLKDFGWSVDSQAAVFRELRRHGLQLTNSLGEVVEGDDPPTGPNDPAPFYTLPSETGMRYRFYPDGPFPADPRTAPSWAMPPVDADDPLGLECCSHHTVVTDQPERGLRMMVDMLGGEVIHSGRDELRGLTSVAVSLGGSTIEYAVPDPGSPAHGDWEQDGGEDTYHAITWKVRDLDRAEQHLQDRGVRILLRSEDVLITDPATSIGIPWGFSTSLLPGDPRATP